MSPPEVSTSDSLPLPNNILPMYQARAAMLTKLVDIMQGRSGIRAEVAEYIASLLNSDVTPTFPKLEGEAGLNVNILSGKFDVVDGSQSISDRVASPPGSGTIVESNTINDLLASPGLLAYAVMSLRGLLPVLDASASLTCEAIKACEVPFSDAYAEKVHAQNGIVASAERMRSLLNLSKNLSAPNSSTLADPSCIRSIPQVCKVNVVLIVYVAICLRLFLYSFPRCTDLCSTTPFKHA